MFLTAKWFGHDDRQIKIGANFNEFDESLFDLVFKMVPFEGDVFSSDFGCFAMSEDDAGLIVFKDLGFCQIMGLSHVEYVF
jgi:hypothetical protein